MKINLKNPIHLFATGFGSGLMRPAPGTWGSLLGIILAVIFWTITQNPFLFLLFAIAGFCAGCYICQEASNDFGVHDDGRIVWDEIMAIWLMFVALPEYNTLYYILTFVLFRLFDIWKPYPIRYIDRKLKGGLGIMFDDVLAAIYALFVLYLISWIF